MSMSLIWGKSRGFISCALGIVDDGFGAAAGARSAERLLRLSLMTGGGGVVGSAENRCLHPNQLHRSHFPQQVALCEQGVACGSGWAIRQRLGRSFHVACHLALRGTPPTVVLQLLP